MSEHSNSNSDTHSSANAAIDSRADFGTDSGEHTSRRPSSNSGREADHGCDVDSDRDAFSFPHGVSGSYANRDTEHRSGAWPDEHRRYEPRLQFGRLGSLSVWRVTDSERLPFQANPEGAFDFCVTPLQSSGEPESIDYESKWREDQE